MKGTPLRIQNLTWYLLGLSWLVASAACQKPPLLSQVVLSGDVITPNGDGTADSALLSYTLSDSALVTIVLTDAQGTQYDFRRGESRPAGQYSARFDGRYTPKEDSVERRVMPNGKYRYTVFAESGSQNVQASGEVEIRDADTKLPRVTDVAVLPGRISPNGDAVDDEAIISYGLSKAALTTLLVTDAKGMNYLLDAEKQRSAALHSHRWNGTAGDRLLPDGTYTLHIMARDQAGNVTDSTIPVTIEGGGRPRLEILSAQLDPSAVTVGGTLNVRIVVKNTGNTVLKSLGPPPNTPYDTVENFLRFRDQDGNLLYYERPGYWRVGVAWEQADRPYPVRWGWGNEPLAPGQEATITGTIRVLIPQTREVQFWTNVIQEGVGFPQDPVGYKRIIISY